MDTTVWARFGEFLLDSQKGLVSVKGFAVKLQPQPLRTLELLVRRAPNIVSREELGKHVWGEGVYVELDANLNYCIRQVRLALGDSAATPVYVETLPKQGYRMSVPVELVDAATAPPPGALNEARAPVAAREWGRTSVWVAALAVCLGLSAWLGWTRLRPARAGAPIRSLAVLPLLNLSGDAGQDYFADGMTDELTTELASIPNLRVASRTSSMLEKGSRKTLRQIAAELHVDAIVEGSVLRSGDDVRITAQLIDARDDRHLWAQSFSGLAGEMVALQERVATQIAANAKVALRPAAERGPATELRTTVPEAHDAYLRGLYFYDQRDPLKSVVYFQRAVELDPAYSSAYAGLAEALGSEPLMANVPSADVIPRATAAARKAIELDPSNGEAYIALGTIEQTLSWDWQAADRDLTHGMELSPGNAIGPMAYALHLSSMGETEAAIPYMRRAWDNDPLSFWMARQYGSVLFNGRHYDEALRQLQRLNEMQPNAPNVVNNWISWIYEKKGMRNEAVAYDLAYLKRRDADTDLDALRARYEQGGWESYWRARLEGMGPGPATGCGLYDTAVMHARLGENEEAISELNGAAAQRCFWMENALVDPMLDDLRGNPRFGDLLRRLNLPLDVSKK